MTDILPMNSSLGELSIDDVLLSYDGPKLFTCTNQLGNWYIAISVDESDDGVTETFLYAPIDESTIRALNLGLIALREVFVEPAEPHVWVVEMNYESGGSTVIPRLASDLSDDWLPKPGVRLESRNESISENDGWTSNREYGSESSFSISLDFSDLQPQDAPDASQRPRCRIGISVLGEAIWGDFNDPSTGGRVDAIEFCKFFSENWIRLFLEEELPSGASIGSLEFVRESFRVRRKRVPFSSRREQEDALEAFYASHDLARADSTTALESILLVKQGLYCWALTEQDARRFNLADVMLPLEEALSDLVLAVSQSGLSGVEDVLSGWNNRWSGDPLEVAAIVTQRPTRELVALQGISASFASVLLSEITDFAESEVLAAARLSRGLSLSHVGKVMDEISCVPKLDHFELLDEISQLIQKDMVEQTFPYDEGLGVARTVRAFLGVSVASAVDPEQLLRDVFGVSVIRIVLNGATGLDAFSAWGPNFGPAVVLNAKGFHNKGNGVNATLAHELGHLLMDRHGALPLADVLLGSQRNDIEARARAFSAELLLPQEAARSAHANWTGTTKALVRRLSKEFRVSSAVAAWNVYNSGSFLSSDEREELRRIAGPYASKSSPAIQNDE